MLKKQFFPNCFGSMRVSVRACLIHAECSYLCSKLFDLKYVSLDVWPSPFRNKRGEKAVNYCSQSILLQILMWTSKISEMFSILFVKLYLLWNARQKFCYKYSYKVPFPLVLWGFQLGKNVGPRALYQLPSPHMVQHVYARPHGLKG